MSNLNKQEAVALKSLRRVLDQFRGLDPDMSVTQCAFLLEIASEEGRSLTDLMKVLNTTQSSASRNVAALSEWHRLGKAGLNLVDNPTDLAERRRKLHVLTPKGRTFIRNLLSYLT